MSLSRGALEGVVLGMEEVLVADPDDLFTHRAYAGVLLRHPEPALAARGRFIEAQLKLEEPARPAEKRKTLQRRGRKLLKDHGRSWLGALAPYLLDQQGVEGPGAYTFEMVRGWLDAVTAPRLDPGFVAALVRAPATRLLRGLVIEDAAPGGAEALAPLHDAPFLTSLRAFGLGAAPASARAAVEALAARMPRVRELSTPWHSRAAGEGREESSSGQTFHASEV